VRLLNTPATLENRGGWFVILNPTNHETMGFLIFSGIFALSFAWMWSRNEKAMKRLKRLKATDKDRATFEQWRDHTRKRMSRAFLPWQFLHGGLKTAR
jgi:hypothetical protein